MNTELSIAIENHMNEILPECIGTLTFLPDALDKVVLKEISDKLDNCKVVFINLSDSQLVVTSYNTLEDLESELTSHGYLMLKDLNVVKVHKDSLRIGTRLDNESGKKLKELYAAARKCVK